MKKRIGAVLLIMAGFAGVGVGSERNLPTHQSSGAIQQCLQENLQCIKACSFFDFKCFFECEQELAQCLF